MIEPRYATPRWADDETIVLAPRRIVSEDELQLAAAIWPVLDYFHDVRMARERLAARTTTT